MSDFAFAEPWPGKAAVEVTIDGRSFLLDSDEAESLRDDLGTCIGGEA